MTPTDPVAEQAVFEQQEKRWRDRTSSTEDLLVSVCAPWISFGCEVVDGRGCGAEPGEPCEESCGCWGPRPPRVPRHDAAVRS